MTTTEIPELIVRASAAQRIAASYDQEQVRRIAGAIGWLAVQRASDWAEMVFAETRLGDVASKVTRTSTRARVLMRDYQAARTVGVIETDEARSLVKIGKPVGVVAALVPTTVPEGVVFIGAMNAIMGRNATVFSPHPRAKGSTARIVAELRELLRRLNVPEDLLLCIESPSVDKTNELMSGADLVVATGGAPMVKAAYSSGTPAYGVGAGNAVAVADETADLDHVASEIASSQRSDLAIGCSTENAAVVVSDVYEDAIAAFRRAGAHVCTSEEKERLRSVLFADGHLNADLICKPAGVIAEAAGIDLANGEDWLIVEESGFGREFPFSGEKLSVVVALYRANGFDDAIDIVNGVHAYSGAGHSCGIYSADNERVMRFAESTNTVRVAVGQATTKSNAGGWTTGMPLTINLGCGTWGGNIASENVTWKHYINTTWVARPIENPVIPSDGELFGSLVDEPDLFVGYGAL
ncbi:aldehyde dehydrogenase family protein [Microbacterium sp. JB110]|uniref:aldehyde dehydrogenase family protein n=1 Tax=Microbacterium sp. JB110 TaxID=2024477 RepID=UPI00097EFB22|nr:aldehyde dehydrogenase family protein [Microbacterium sp. JB110]SJM43765.1 Alcohol dehydrogenase; Acetaldehyde dehydrogenase [Frigoribacterium sp. JB110]